ncbi:hypothetical protein VE23_21375 [Paenibacillus sp. D9]|nr:hypothetical protein VE23_21375 [Paenibacillus sp. D9]
MPLFLEAAEKQAKGAESFRSNDVVTFVTAFRPQKWQESEKYGDNSDRKNDPRTQRQLFQRPPFLRGLLFFSGGTF